MTMIIVVLIGTGALLFISGIEGTSLKDTFTQILTNQPLDLSGTAPSQPSTSTSSTTTSTSVTPSKGNKSCPSGYMFNATTGVCDKIKTTSGPQ